jgi:hypothetical protein
MMSLDDLELEDLKIISKQLFLKNIGRIKKKDTLISRLRIQLSIIRIQKWFRDKVAYNDICPISLERVRYPCWGYRTYNKFTYYNLPELAYYFVTSGDFRDPSTRNIVTISHVTSLANVLKQDTAMSKIKLIKAFHSDEQFRLKRQQEERRDVLEDTVMTVITEISEDLHTIDENIKRNIEMDVHQLLAPKACEFRICMSILYTVCVRTCQRITMWSINKINQVKPESNLVKKLQSSLVSFIRSALSSL